MEAVGSVLSGFELERSRGDPIDAPGRFTVTTLFVLLNMMMMRMIWMMMMMMLMRMMIAEFKIQNT